ncbi:MAG: hypothetical protein KJ749_03700 [Planctomycetes bacterium]|nr:hypothetical protein [Planctomycetota bacterium]
MKVPKDTPEGVVELLECAQTMIDAAPAPGDLAGWIKVYSEMAIEQRSKNAKYGEECRAIGSQRVSSHQQAAKEAEMAERQRIADEGHARFEALVAVCEFAKVIQTFRCRVPGQLAAICASWPDAKSMKSVKPKEKRASVVSKLGALVAG